MGLKLEITSGTGLEPNLPVNQLGAACQELQGVWRFPGSEPGYLLPSVHQPHTANSIPSVKGLCSELTGLPVCISII